MKVEYGIILISLLLGFFIGHFLDATGVLR